MTTEIFCFYLKNRLIQTIQTGGQWYSDISPFSIPWIEYTADAMVCSQMSTSCTQPTYLTLLSGLEVLLNVRGSAQSFKQYYHIKSSI